MRTITVTAERIVAADAYGDPQEPATFKLTDCIIAPRRSSDTDERGRDGVVVGLSLYLRVAADVTDLAAVTIADGIYKGRWEVEGVPAQWISPYTGELRGYEIALRHAKG